MIGPCPHTIEKTNLFHRKKKWVSPVLFRLSSLSIGDILHLLFRLKHQRLVEDYSCAIADTILFHGRMVSIQMEGTKIEVRKCPEEESARSFNPFRLPLRTYRRYIHLYVSSLLLFYSTLPKIPYVSIPISLVTKRVKSYPLIVCSIYVKKRPFLFEVSNLP